VGRRLSFDEHAEVLAWGNDFKSMGPIQLAKPLGNALRKGARRELDLYWNLAALSRADTRRPELAAQAGKIVFRVRVLLERGLASVVRSKFDRGGISSADLFDGDFFGCSIKQGVSLRVPLASCVPTKDCHAACYAHDGMDAGRNPVVKGVLNGVVAELFEVGGTVGRNALRASLKPHVVRAVRAARAEALAAGFFRQPRIRFSHVGEIAAFPDFANELAKMVHEESEGDVACVVYTRHPNARLLDPNLIVTNFTLDRSSSERLAWAPATARLVYSAWDGRTTDEVAVNFLEHHRLRHVKPSGTGSVCPVTAPASTIRTCDAARCTLCFQKDVSAHPTRSADDEEHD
jgi:hypothetical protein